MNTSATLPGTEVEAGRLQGAAEQGGVVGAKLNDGGIVAREGGAQGIEGPYIGGRWGSVVGHNIGESNSRGSVQRERRRRRRQRVGVIVVVGGSTTTNSGRIHRRVAVILVLMRHDRHQQSLSSIIMLG